ncbi:hypothetical protein CHS0354_012471 [Potamilus streckersoni]|uniref:Uncharacterized protein n=1 Tax=Potamilus streckersoni TaxID=2493646 RepID=A0AAE0S019_9BIVA|nr:hypothetical protein CHS0354_012471 [Potamilus streckersoni]
MLAQRASKQPLSERRIGNRNNVITAALVNEEKTWYRSIHTLNLRRFMHLKILVSSQNATLLPRVSPAFQECGNYVGHSSDGNIITIKCPGKTIGRWVRIQAVLGIGEYFHFCEVEVFGY